MIKAALIDTDNLIAMVYSHGGDLIGVNPRTGKETTVFEELTEVGRLADRAELILVHDYYQRDYQRLRRDFTEEDLKGEAIRSIINAGKKLLFVNKMAGKESLCFVTERLDKANVQDMYDLIKAYQYAIVTWNVFE